MVEGLDWHDWGIQHDIEPDAGDLSAPGAVAPPPVPAPAAGD
jgi:hypothetical protein